MNQTYQKLLDCYESIKDRIPFSPKVALVLGSGLGNYADSMEVKAEIDYSEIKDFPVYGLDPVQLRLEDMDQGLDTSYEGELLILPNTIKPTTVPRSKNISMSLTAKPFRSPAV